MIFKATFNTTVFDCMNKLSREYYEEYEWLMMFVVSSIRDLKFLRLVIITDYFY